MRFFITQCGLNDYDVVIELNAWNAWIETNDNNFALRLLQTTNMILDFVKFWMCRHDFKQTHFFASICKFYVHKLRLVYVGFDLDALLIYGDILIKLKLELLVFKSIFYNTGEATIIRNLLKCQELVDD